MAIFKLSGPWCAAIAPYAQGKSGATGLRATWGLRGVIRKAGVAFLPTARAPSGPKTRLSERFTGFFEKSDFKIDFYRKNKIGFFFFTPLRPR